MDKTETPIIIKDSEEIKNLLIQINLKSGTTAVISNNSAWDNIAFLIEALKVTIEKCVQDGMDRKEALKELKSYLSKTFTESTWVQSLP